MTETELRQLLERITEVDTARLMAAPGSPERAAADAELTELMRVIFSTPIEGDRAA